MQDWEVLYSVRLSRDGRFLEVSKWAGEQIPESIYRITDRGFGRCTCNGAMRRNSECRHMRMVREMREGGLSWAGGFYDPNVGLYTPADGEGIPVSGAVDVIALALDQGKLI